ncbi:MAG: response regulator [Eubacteriales bacterium]
MIRAVIIDDERHAHNRFMRVTKEVEGIEVVGTFTNEEDTIAFLTQNQVDVVFLDIEMPGKTGIHLARDIQNMQCNIDIVFLTAHQKYAVEAFELDVTDYIVKPITAVRLENTIIRLRADQEMRWIRKKPKITCFGAFSVAVDGQQLMWKNRRAKELLAYLVHRSGVPASWEQIAEALWFDFDYDKAHANLHTTMYRLRKQLAHAGIAHILEGRRDNYRIKPEEVDCDYYVYKDTGKMPVLHERYFEEDGYSWAAERTARIERIQK